MTKSAKIDHVGAAKTEIHFIAQDYSYTQELSMHHSVSTVQCELVCFSGGGHFADPVKP